jgi:hypothetical protein
MKSNLRRRLVLLEHSQTVKRVAFFDFNTLRAGAPIDWTPPDPAAHRAAQESHPVVVALRKQYERLGMPQPESLDGIDVTEECLRLAGVRDQDELSALFASREQVRF